MQVVRMVHLVPPMPTHRSPHGQEALPTPASHPHQKPDRQQRRLTGEILRRIEARVR